MLLGPGGWGVQASGTGAVTLSLKVSFEGWANVLNKTHLKPTDLVQPSHLTDKKTGPERGDFP